MVKRFFAPSTSSGTVSLTRALDAISYLTNLKSLEIEFNPNDPFLSMGRFTINTIQPVIPTMAEYYLKNLKNLQEIKLYCSGSNRLGLKYVLTMFSRSKSLKILEITLKGLQDHNTLEFFDIKKRLKPTKTCSLVDIQFDWMKLIDNQILPTTLPFEKIKRLKKSTKKMKKLFESNELHYSSEISRKPRKLIFASNKLF